MGSEEMLCIWQTIIYWKTNIHNQYTSEYFFDTQMYKKTQRSSISLCSRVVACRHKSSHIAIRRIIGCCNSSTATYSSDCHLQTMPPRVEFPIQLAWQLTYLPTLSFVLPTFPLSQQLWWLLRLVCLRLAISHAICIKLSNSNAQTYWEQP